MLVIMSAPWLALKDLLVEAVERTTSMVERAHRSSARRVFDVVAAAPPLTQPARTVEALHKLQSTAVYSSIRLANRAADRVIDGAQRLVEGIAEENTERPAATSLTPMRSDALGGPAWLRDSAAGLLNGAFGDHLEEQNSPLACPMSLRHEGAPVAATKAALTAALPHATGRLCILLHGLACTEWSFNYDAQLMFQDPSANYGTLLARDLDMTPLFVRYNTGRHISHNGRELAALLQRLVDAYPLPVEEIVLIGHSMGGLLARSACHYADATGWVKQLRRVICLGSPHLGAPLEQASNLLSLVLRSIDTMGTQIPGHLLNARSAGIKDLRFGYILDEDWQRATPDSVFDMYRGDVPFIEHADYYFVAGTITEDPSHPLGQLVGDVMVRPKSAAGVHREPLRSVPFDAAHGATAAGLSHLRLINHPAVYQHILRWCRPSDEPARP